MAVLYKITYEIYERTCLPIFQFPQKTDESGQYSTNGCESSMVLTDSVSGHNTYNIESKCNTNFLIYS